MMTPMPAARARATNSGSTFLEQNGAMAGTLERNISVSVPDGEMSSVETLSPSLIRTGAVRVSSGGRPRGTSLILGPLTTSTVADSPGEAGGTSPASEAARDPGSRLSAAAPALRGSVITPWSADTAAVTGEQR